MQKSAEAITSVVEHKIVCYLCMHELKKLCSDER